ncbi:MAG: hypothetical protein KME60_21690 [Cyanomargarita calcarea GSE-NOS-MK-12-04C]|jgi:hypothetical protein|uniref:Uncharacterized protein n=1 Tax=Cyanomargarita calcarea GSE-NOS-MK-12-04C TaxID=2839659 RepID=A0A951QQ60_9CYAN|nr:hypothetical protein [Cyanomargarita calcarea GSE-NOS-MK-12-04C]
MSSYKSSFEIFLELYKENSDLFSNCEDEVKILINELDELNKSEPETVVEDRILDWLELPEHADILRAFQTRLSPDSPDTWGPNNSESPTPPNKPSPVAHEMLENSIQPNSEAPKGSGGSTSSNANGIDGIFKG